MEKKTPLYDRHVALGGKIVPFAGYLLPVQYPTGVIAEHMAVRTAAGLFDVSHMGELVFTGPDALANLNHMLTNDFTDMYDGQVRYSPMCNETGAVWTTSSSTRSGRGPIWWWSTPPTGRRTPPGWRTASSGTARWRTSRTTVAQVALQGPRSKEILLRLVGEEELPKKYYSFVREITREGHPVPGLPHRLHRGVRL